MTQSATNPLLAECQSLLVRRWGEMGGYWGISRTMAEVHALLFVEARPLCTDDVMQRLHVSRGNASMTLRALVDWGLVRRVHKIGDRREYFEADTDIWRVFETIMRERRRREVEPIIETIDRCCRRLREQPGAAGEAEIEAFLRRLDELRGFLSTMGTLLDTAVRFGPRLTGLLRRLVPGPAAEENSKRSAAALRRRPGAGSKGKVRR